MKSIRKKKISGILAIILLTSTAVAQDSKKEQKIKTLVVFFDGLRPDYITPELMPNVYSFSQSGSYGKRHHSVFPTVTRVNATSFSTGSYPTTHGLMGNSVYFPEVYGKRGINTGDYQELEKINKTTNGGLLTTTTLGEIIQKAGARMMIFSSGSTGQALMQNHTVAGGAIINPELILPISLKEEIIKEIGPIPEKKKPNKAQHQWITNAFMKYGLDSNGPLVSSIWYSDPDGTAHRNGIGDSTVTEAIKFVDAEFGRILNEMKRRNLKQYFNIIISADHGFVTHIGNTTISDFLINEGLKKDKDSDDVVIVGRAIYVKNHNAITIQKIVTALQNQDWIGAIFSKAKKTGELTGSIQGTLSFESIHWNHKERTADIMVDVNWNDNINENGYAGKGYSKGLAGHGGLSPYEVNIALLVEGPSFKKNIESVLPTSNVDIAPTILAIHGLPIPETMDGRVIEELLTGEKTKNKDRRPKKESIKTTVELEHGSYTLILNRTVLGEYFYVDSAQVERTH
ncbi:alkaline phosphatase family protein [Zobellia roscoffensis]|uniref:alkaline phosphatase family protein n=1 Tax=Zobellia roscoffensis TaxID=2779508 RepID=UPI00188BB4CC|nr:nucleotide pyrophosphatase/phosphodiesterase family protein [Zobellia roscoffensis]